MPVNMPTISVVIPLYHHEKYIRASVESVLKQDLNPSEIIIVGDHQFLKLIRYVVQ